LNIKYLIINKRMTQLNFAFICYSEILEFISKKNKTVIPDKISLQEVKAELTKLLNQVMDHLCESFIHKDDWPDDDEYQQVTEYIYFIADKIEGQ